MKGFPGRELSLDPRPQPVRAAVRAACSARRPTGCASGCAGCCPPPRARTGRSWTPAAAPGCSASSSPSGTRRPRSLGVDSEPDLVARANEIAERARPGQLPVPGGRRHQARLRRRVRPGRSASTTSSTSRTTSRPCARCCTRCARAGGWWSTSPVTSGGGSCFGRRVNFDVPGHVRPGYRADELVGQAAARPASRSPPTSTPTGAIETFTNNISYLITGADQRNKLAYAAVFPVLLALSYLGKFSRPRWGAGVLAVARRAADRRRLGRQRPGLSADAMRDPHRHPASGPRPLLPQLPRARWTDRGHELCITARDKDRSVELLRAYDLPYQQISQQKSGAGLAVEMAQRTARLMKVMRSFRPDVMTGIMGPSIALAGALRLRGCRRWCSTTPSSPCRPTGWCSRWRTACARRTATRGRSGAGTDQYAGYHELAYLHPNRFQPDPGRLAEFGVGPDEPYSIVRFVSWQAVHDRRERGLTAKQKRHLVEVLQRRGRVLISSEAPAHRRPGRPGRPRAGRADPPPDRPRPARGGRVGDHVLGGGRARGARGVHRHHRPGLHRRRGAALRAGPALHRGPVRHGRCRPSRRCSPRPASAWQAARQRLLDEKIDVTAWMVDYFETSFAGRVLSDPTDAVTATCAGSRARPASGTTRCVRAMTDTIAHRGPDGEGFYSATASTSATGGWPSRTCPAAPSRWPTRTAPSSSSTTARSTTTRSCATGCWPAATG